MTSQNDSPIRFIEPDEVVPVPIVAEHCNTEREKLTIERCQAGPFAGKLLLVIHDDESAGGTLAPMLLDAGTAEFLIAQLTALLPEFQQGTGDKP